MSNKQLDMGNLNRGNAPSSSKIILTSAVFEIQLLTGSALYVRG
jgi:hypothetical protein